MRVLADAHVRLLRSIRSLLDADPLLADWLDCASGFDRLVVEDFTSEPWASLTFQGMRHGLWIRLSGPEAEVRHAQKRLVELLEDPDVAMPGHFLAEFALVDSNEEHLSPECLRLSVHFEALTIEE